MAFKGITMISALGETGRGSRLRAACRMMDRFGPGASCLLIASDILGSQYSPIYISLDRTMALPPHFHNIEYSPAARPVVMQYECALCFV